MSYILKQYDTPLIKFNINKDSFGISTKILWVNEEKRNLLPLSLNKNLDNLSSWLRHRTIPSNRAFVENFLAKLGLNEKTLRVSLTFAKDFHLMTVTGLLMKISRVHLQTTIFMITDLVKHYPLWLLPDMVAM